MNSAGGAAGLVPCSLLASPSGTYELKHTGLEQYSEKPLMELPSNNHYNILYKYGCLLAFFPRKILV